MSNHVYRRKGSPNWWLSVQVPGRRRLRRSSGSPRKDIAQALADRLEAKEWHRHTNGDEATLTFAEAVILYRQAGKPAAYLKSLVLHFRDRAIASIAAGDIHAAARLLYPGRAPATHNRQAIVPARAVINHAADLGLCPHVRVRLFRESPPARRAVDGAWLDAFARAAPPHLGALALFMAATGARIGQAIALGWEDIDLQSGEARIPAAKGFPERIAFLPPAIVAALANIAARKHRLRRHRGRHPVFGLTSRSSIYRQWRRACANAGIAYVPSHQAGRHTFFTEMIVRNRVDAKTAGMLGGAASPSLLLKTYSHPEDGRGTIDAVIGTMLAHKAPDISAKPLTRKAK